MPNRSSVAPVAGSACVIRRGDWVVTCSAEDVIWVGRAETIHQKTNEVTITYYEEKKGGYVRSDGSEPWVEHVASLSVVEPAFFVYCSKRKHFKCLCNLRKYINVPVIDSPSKTKRKRVKKGGGKNRKIQKQAPQEKSPRLAQFPFASALSPPDSRRSSRRQAKPKEQVDPLLQVLVFIVIVALAI